LTKKNGNLFLVFIDISLELLYDGEIDINVNWEEFENKTDGI
jgi:hypothetical protein